MFIEALGIGGGTINPVEIDRVLAKNPTKQYNLESGKSYFLFGVYRDYGNYNHVFYIKDNVITNVYVLGNNYPQISCVNNVLTISRSGAGYNDMWILVQVD
jgi:hypothetical protein